MIKQFIMESMVLNRLRNLIFKMRRRSAGARFAEIMRRVNRMARLMTVIQKKPGRNFVRRPMSASGGKAEVARTPPEVR
jgi:hypothetical protein